MKKKQGRSLKTQRKAVVRASITFPPDLYETLEKSPRRKKVSLASVVRDVAEKYTAEQKTGDRKQREG